MSTHDERLDLFLEGGRYCTRFRRKTNDSSVYLRLDNLEVPLLTVRIIGRHDDSNNFINYTYKTESFPIFAGKKYFLYNLSPPNEEVRLEFEGPQAALLNGYWSPDSLPENGCITVGPEYKNAQSKGNTKDEPFCFTATQDNQVFTTNYRDKNTDSSVYLNLQQSSFQGTVSISIFGCTLGESYPENCTNKALNFYAESGKKYEVFFKN